MSQVTPEPRRLPFELVASASEGPSPEPRLRVIISTIDGMLPDGFTAGDDPPFLLTPSDGTHVVYFEITLTSDKDAVASVAIEQGASLPEDTDSKKYVSLGDYTFSADSGGFSAINNYAYGPGSTTICRDWFSNPPKYGFSLSFPGYAGVF
jgi:hypothetical protein